jgi:hypothetical protein
VSRSFRLEARRREQLLVVAVTGSAATNTVQTVCRYACAWVLVNAEPVHMLRQAGQIAGFRQVRISDSLQKRASDPRPIVALSIKPPEAGTACLSADGFGNDRLKRVLSTLLIVKGANNARNGSKVCSKRVQRALIGAPSTGREANPLSGRLLY